LGRGGAFFLYQLCQSFFALLAWHDDNGSQAGAVTLPAILSDRNASAVVVFVGVSVALA
jgi:hypothetical protein